VDSVLCFWSEYLEPNAWRANKNMSWTDPELLAQRNVLPMQQNEIHTLFFLTLVFTSLLPNQHAM
jgi:hypothetical protein